MTPRDRGFLRRQLLTVLVLLAFPYLVLVLLTPRGTTYTGVLFNPNDSFLYFAQMAHAQRGEWLFRDWFTYIPGRPLLAYLLYSLLGRLLPTGAGATGIALAYHLARLLLAAGFVLQAWRLFGEMSRSRVTRRVALLFLLFTSGAGVYQLLVPGLRTEEPPFDLLITESSAFAGLAFSPHFAAVLLGLVVYMRAVLALAGAPRRRWTWWAAGALAALAVTTVHPDKAAVMAAGTVLFVAWRAWGRHTTPACAAVTVSMLLPSIPYVLYSFALTANDPHIRSLMAQGLPHESVANPVLYYGFGFGLPLLFALANVGRAARLRGHLPVGEVLAWSFVVAGALVILVPFRNVGHRAEGLQLALAWLAGRGAALEVLPRLWRTRVFRRLGRRRVLGYSRRRLRLLTLNLALILSSTSVLALAFASPRAALAGVPEAYASHDDLVVTSWLRDHAGADDVAVGESTSDQFLAAYGGVRAAWGSFSYTPGYVPEGVRLADMYLGRLDPQRYLLERHIRWLYFGPRERRYAHIRPQELGFLRLAYASGQTSLYEVTSGQALEPEASHLRNASIRPSRSPSSSTPLALPTSKPVRWSLTWVYGWRT